MSLPPLALELLGRPAFATLGTLGPDGAPRQCLMWATHDGDDLLLASKRGRRQVEDLARDPRATLLLFDPEDGRRYVELRGTTTIVDAGARDLIERLSLAYTGRAHDVPEDAPGEAERCVLRVRVTRAVAHGDR
jgi:PPOX class probable F420-dependent enzyme